MANCRAFDRDDGDDGDGGGCDVVSANTMEKILLQHDKTPTPRKNANRVLVMMILPSLTLRVLDVFVSRDDPYLCLY